MILFTSGLRLAEALEVAESTGETELKVYVFYKEYYTVDFPLLERFAASSEHFEFIRSDDEGMFMFKLGEMNATLPQGTEIMTLFSDDFEMPAFLGERWNLKPYAKKKKPAKKAASDPKGKKGETVEEAAPAPKRARKAAKKADEKAEDGELYKEANGQEAFSGLLGITPEEAGFKGTVSEFTDSVAKCLKESGGRNRNFQLLIQEAFGEENGNRLFDAVSENVKQLRALLNK